MTAAIGCRYKKKRVKKKTKKNNETNRVSNETNNNHKKVYVDHTAPGYREIPALQRKVRHREPVRVGERAAATRLEPAAAGKRHHGRERGLATIAVVLGLPHLDALPHTAEPRNRLGLNCACL
jgi:restriction endonuclease Mrr